MTEKAVRIRTWSKFVPVFVLLLTLLLIPFIYYYPRLGSYFEDPSKFAKLFLSASGIASFSLSLLYINIGVFFSAAVIDLAVNGWKKSVIKRLIFKPGKSTKGDLWCWALSLFSLYDFFTLIFSFGVFYVIASLIVKTGGFNLIRHIPFVPLQFLLLFLIVDLKHYLWHRFMHQQPFWELHKYHHSATEFNLMTAARGHFLEKGILVVFDSILFSLMGAPIQQFALLLLLKEFYTQLQHSDINISFGWFGKYIFVSPKAHRLHHSELHVHHDKNFGSVFIFWDRLFRTYSETDEKIKIGVKNNQYNNYGFWWDMKEGTRAFVLSSVVSLRRLPSHIQKTPRKIAGYFKNNVS